MVEQFRKWFRHERDCNLKIIEMLQTIPDDKKSLPEYVKAVSLFGHLAAARHNWLCRLGYVNKESIEWFDVSQTLDAIKLRLTEIEPAWESYLETINDSDLSHSFEWMSGDQSRWQWNLEGLLAQVNGHHWYHRGQIVLLIDMLGGMTVDTDYIFWDADVSQLN